VRGELPWLAEQLPNNYANEEANVRVVRDLVLIICATICAASMSYVVYRIETFGKNFNDLYAVAVQGSGPAMFRIVRMRDMPNDPINTVLQRVRRPEAK
jgi:hypothetical protein